MCSAPNTDEQPAAGRDGSSLDCASYDRTCGGDARAHKGAVNVLAASRAGDDSDGNSCDDSWEGSEAGSEGTEGSSDDGHTVWAGGEATAALMGDWLAVHFSRASSQASGAASESEGRSRSSSLMSEDCLTEDEHDVIARLAEEDWGVIEEMVGAAKPVRESALVKIIMPFHSEAGQTSKAARPSRRGGRRGMTRRRSSESLDTMAAAATALRESFALC